MRPHTQLIPSGPQDTQQRKQEELGQREPAGCEQVSSNAQSDGDPDISQVFNGTRV